MVTELRKIKKIIHNLNRHETIELPVSQEILKLITNYLIARIYSMGEL